MRWASVIAAAALLGLTVLTASAQPGANMDLPSLTGDVLDTGSLNTGFNMLATTLQMQTLLFSNPAFVAKLQADAEAYQKAGAELRAQLQAQGEQVIASGQASTQYRAIEDHQLEPAVRKIFGYRGQNTPLVPAGLKLFRDYAGSIGLAQNDVADASALLVGTCYEIFTGEVGAVNERALADLRERARRDLLADPVFQGMGDNDRQFVYDVFGVWTIQSAVDYHELTARLAEPQFIQTASPRESLDRLRGTCGSTLQSSFGVAPEHVHVTPTGIALDN